MCQSRFKCLKTLKLRIICLSHRVICYYTYLYNVNCQDTFFFFHLLSNSRPSICVLSDSKPAGEQLVSLGTACSNDNPNAYKDGTGLSHAPMCAPLTFGWMCKR